MRINDGRVPVDAVRQRGKPEVIISLDDCDALEETADFMRNSKGMMRLMESVEELCSGGRSGK